LLFDTIAMKFRVKFQISVLTWLNIDSRVLKFTIIISYLSEDEGDFETFNKK